MILYREIIIGLVAKLHEQRKDPFQHKLQKLLVKVFGDWEGVCWYACHYQFLPELLTLLKCPPSLNP